MPYVLNREHIDVLAGQMVINQACGAGAVAFAKLHIPETESPEFLRGMTTGLMLAMNLLGDDDPDCSNMLRCLAAWAALVATKLDLA